MLNATFPGSRPDSFEMEVSRPGPVVVYMGVAERASHCTVVKSDVTTRQ
jgi:hypothetical protein